MSKRKLGKVITTTTYRKNGHTIEVPLRLVKRSLVEEHYYGEQLMYLVDIDEPRVLFLGEDAEKVRQQAFAELDRLCSIVWEKKIVIHFQIGECNYNNAGSEKDCSVEFRYEFMLFGKTIDGKKVHLQLNDDRTPRYQRATPTADWPTDDRQEYEQIAAIDDTPENEAKVRSIRDAIDLLGRRMIDLFSQKNLAHTMANIRTLGLPMPEAKKKS